MKNLLTKTLFTAVLGGACLPAIADVRLPAILADDMVVQCDQPIVLWGWADPGEAVTAKLAEEQQQTQAGADGRWRLELAARPAGGPVEIAIAGNNALTLHNVLIGDVWFCSGQSNMEMKVENSMNASEEVAAADHPSIRLFSFPRVRAIAPQDDCPGKWAVCSPASVGAFSATAYFFGRELQPVIGVPLGLVHSSYGGTPAEAWTRAEALAEVPEMKPLLEQARTEAEAWTSGATMAAYNAELARWQQAAGAGEAGSPRTATLVADGKPEGVAFPQQAWVAEPTGLLGAGADNLMVSTVGLGAGDFTVQATLALDKVLESSAYVILGNSHFGFSDMTWGRMFTRGQVFGPATALVGRTEEFIADGKPFRFEAARRGATLTISIDGKKVHAVDCGAGALGRVGLCPGKRSLVVKDFTMEGEPAAADTATVAFAKPVEPADPRLRSSFPSVLFNGMVNPLLPIRIKGVIWYQGESNHERAVQYRALFPALIRNWRSEWQQADLPFLFVQIANYGKVEPQPAESDWAELREAQMMTLSLPHTGMAVAIDVGEGADIHPKNKQAVGQRLALAARALVYGEDIPYSGPIYRGMTVEDGRIRIRFDHAADGLAAKGGPLTQFAIAGADRKFHWAKAEIDGSDVIVSGPEVASPVAVRYAWAANPEGCNLYNAAGLPASPFRTDDWPVLSSERMR